MYTGWLESTHKSLQVGSQKGDKVNFLTNTWIPNMHSLHSTLQGLWQEPNMSMKINTTHPNGEWDFSAIHYPIPEAITTVIQCTFIPYSTTAEDKLIWNLTSNGMLSAKYAYSFKENPICSILHFKRIILVGYGSSKSPIKSSSSLGFYCTIDCIQGNISTALS